MKTILGALALVLAAPVSAQTAPAAANPHAGHAQHHAGGQQAHGAMNHDAMNHADHSKMMQECQKAMAEGKCKEHCAAMMKQHAATPAATADAHEGHAH